jgi:spore maturation protein CgeB
VGARRRLSADDGRRALRALDGARRRPRVKASGVGVFDELLERAVLDLLRTLDAGIIFWDVDAPATLDRVHATRPIRSALVPRYDLVSPTAAAAGGARVHWRSARRAACRSTTRSTRHAPPRAADPRFAADLGFLGNRLPDREARVDEFFLRGCALLPQPRFLLGGSGWDDKRCRRT